MAGYKILLGYYKRTFAAEMVQALWPTACENQDDISRYETALEAIDKAASASEAEVLCIFDDLYFEDFRIFCCGQEM